MSKYRRLSLFAVIALAAGLVLVAACGDDDDEDSAAGAATAAAPATAYPVTVTDLLGRTVEIAQKPAVVVGLSPTAVEFVYSVGGTVSGRSSSVDYPEAARGATDIGSAYQPSIEAILALNPDLVVADSIIHAQPQLRSALEALEVPVIFAGADSLLKVTEGIRLMGAVFDASDRAEALVEEIEQAQAAARDALAASSVSAVALIADRDQTLYAGRADSYVGDILKQIGVQNPAAEEPVAGPFPGYTAIAPEQLLQFDPDFILTITPAPEPAPRLSSLIPQIPPFRGLQAVTDDHVIELDIELFLQAPGPRVLEAMRALVAALTGE